MNAEDLAAELALLDFYRGRPAFLPGVAGAGETPAPAGTCRHCGLWKANRPRGLCWHCFYTPGVREQYPRGSRVGVGGGCGGYRTPAAPTSARPGSPEKVAVLEERARLGLSLWHPLDAPMDREGADLAVF